jgi:protein SCO1/2
MNFPPVTRRAALLSLGALAAMSQLPAVAAPGDSIYQLPATLGDQDGKPFELASLQGGPVLASMFYASCDMVCPMIFETVQLTLRALPAAQRAGVRVLMVSFDPARDTTAVLKKTALARGCDAQWLLARTDEGTARKIAAVLGIQYRRLANGEFNHSSTILLLDAQGRIAARSGKMGSVDPALVAALRT